MKISFISLILIIFFSNSNCQSTPNSTADALFKKVNKLQELKYSYTNLPKVCYSFEINLKDSILIFRYPNMLTYEDKPSSIGIRMIYIKDLHPKSSLALDDKYEEGCVLRFVPRNHEEKIFSYNLNIKDFLRYGDAAPNKYAMRSFNFFGINYKECVYLEEISSTFEDFITEMNPNIPDDEEPPNPSINKLPESALRQQTINLISNLEKSDPNRLVLPSYNVKLDHPPLYAPEENLENSIAAFETTIIASAKYNEIRIQKDIAGDLVIDEEGNIIEVLMAKKSTPLLGVDIGPNKKIKELILISKKWKPAEHRGKRLVVKVRFFLNKNKVNAN